MQNFNAGLKSYNQNKKYSRTLMLTFQYKQIHIENVIACFELYFTVIGENVFVYTLNFDVHYFTLCVHQHYDRRIQ